ncbi:MAG TPA: NAD(P)H-dependent oxidoreductase subunit E, partial [Lacibacter sp.]|nr:NAD(P)H-dependent oxidoreductase subunit E [Lacibacter sp.]
MQEPLQTRLLDRLWELQLQYGCIRDEDIGKLAADLQLSAIEVEGVVSFYHFFHRKPTGRYTIYLNNSIVAEHKGYQRIREAFERETGAVMGSVDRTGTFGLFSTPCIGLSDHEPSGLINFHPFTHLNAIRVKDIVTALKNGADPATLCDEPDDQVRYLPPDDKSVFFRPFTPGTALAKAKALGPEGVLDELRTAELSGRGGAYYPAWKKWEASRQQPARPKYVVCNADEGEPGTFKDRVLLHSQAGSLLEGMLLCAYTIGAEHLI